MLDVLTKHLEGIDKGTKCVVRVWVESLSEEEQSVMQELKTRTETVVLAQLYKDLEKETKLPFKMTVFRGHMRGYCSCQKN
jgi:hypothetical protein